MSRFVLDGTVSVATGVFVDWTAHKPESGVNDAFLSRNQRERYFQCFVRDAASPARLSDWHQIDRQVLRCNSIRTVPSDVMSDQALC
tara:strand:- start:200387 stop:200647 length:261 start_codon:yes stop_codon:yes gene_type:complete